MQNKGTSANNTSGYKGVSWNKEKKKWVAFIWINSEKYDLGYHSSIESAYARRLKAEKELHGEFARAI